MQAVVDGFVIGASTAAFVALWFAHAHRVLARKHEDVSRAEEQVRLHREGSDRVLSGLSEQTARRMVETSSQICTQIKKSYNETLDKPIYRFPGRLMGFRRFEEQKGG